MQRKPGIFRQHRLSGCLRNVTACRRIVAARPDASRRYFRLIVTAAFAVFVGSATEVALTVTVGGFGAVFGAT